MRKKLVFSIICCFVTLLVSCSWKIQQQGEITGLSATESTNSVILKWTNPTDSEFDHLEIIATPTDKSLSVVTVKTDDKTIETYTVTGLLAAKEYTFMIKTVTESNKTSEGCDGVKATPFGTSTGINPPSWIIGTWAGNISSEGIDAYNVTWEFKNDTCIETSEGQETNYKNLLKIQPNIEEIASITSTTSSTQFLLCLTFSDGYIENITFKQANETSLNMLDSCDDYSGELILDGEYTDELTKSVSIAPPQWIRGTWTGKGIYATDESSTEPYNLSIQFTDDNFITTIEDAVTSNNKVIYSFDENINSVTSNYTSNTFTVHIDLYAYYIELIFTLNNDGTLNCSYEKTGPLAESLPNYISNLIKD